MGYFPEPVSVTWDTGSLSKSATTLQASALGTSGLYSTTSWVTASSEEAKQEFTCRVVHAPSGTHDNTTVRACSASFSTPTVKLFHSSCEPPEGTSSPVQLLCLISGYTPSDMKVTWLVQGQEAENAIWYTAPDKIEGELASTRSELNITWLEWVSEKTYTCRVTYRGQNFEDSTRRCTDSDPRGVTAYLSPPSPLELYVQKSAKITCLVVDLASKEGLSLTWSRDSRKPVTPGSPDVRKQYNGTFTAMSTLPVEASDWVKGETYECRVTHPDLPRDLVRTIRKADGQRIRPEVYVFPPPEEDQETRSTLTLTCLIQNFSPADVSVQWLRNQVPLPDAQHSTTPPRLAPGRANGTGSAFFVFSRLEVARSQWDQNDEFTCRVVHETLPGDDRTFEKAVSRTFGKAVSKTPGK
uniref:Ig-like domain-containing protein n=1 Tax=Microcebus murinus TaxID=30608 RepID=A0A8C5VC72_MICMU